MATARQGSRQGSLLPPIKVTGIEDRATLAAFESVEDVLDTLAARGISFVVSMAFATDVVTLAEITVFRAARSVELTGAVFVATTNVTAAVIITLSRRGATGDGQVTVGVIDGRESGFTAWQEFNPKAFRLSGPRRVDPGQQVTLAIAANGAAGPLRGSLELEYREVA